MSEATSGNSIIDHSFVPILALESALQPHVTPFNFIPFNCAYQAYKLQILSSIPFGIFSGITENEQSILIEYTFLNGGLANIKKHLSMVRRPIVLWISQTSPFHRSLEVIQTILNSQPFVFLIIMEDIKLASRFRDMLSQVPITRVLYLPEVESAEDQRAILIWQEYLKLFVALEEILSPGTILMNLPPDRSAGKSFAEILKASDSGDVTPATERIENITLYDDFIYYPNAIIANHSRYKLPKWQKGAAPADIVQRKVYEHAHEILERKSLGLFFDQLAEVKEQVKGESSVSRVILRNLAVYDHILPKEFSVPLFDILREKKTEAEASEIFINAFSSYPKHVFRQYTMPFFILSCQSYPFTWQELKHIASISQNVSVSYLMNEDESLYNTYFDRIIEGGRFTNFQVPDDSPKHEETVQVLGTFSRFENNFLSAISVFFACRRLCPVFKTHRAGRAIFSSFHLFDETINGYINSLEQEPPAVTKQTATRMLSLITDLSEKTTALIDNQILKELFVTKSDPFVFLLSDIPLDFVKVGADYLGYSAVLSRLPITPGQIPVNYYNHTGKITDLDNNAEETAIVTSFVTGTKERELLEHIVSNSLWGMPVKIIPVQSRFELINFVNNNLNIKCLIFFGHGGIERDSNQSWIKLPKDNFFNDDINKLKNVPKTIVLIGCNTSSGGNTMSGMDIPFLMKGAQVIATTFPIPLIMGTTFIVMFLRNFLSPGVSLENGVRYYTDLSDILTVVKRRLRINSVLINLQMHGNLTESGAKTLMASYVSNYTELEERDKGNDHNPSIAIKKALVQNGFIDSEETPLYEIEKIPFTLFFTCLGYSWNNKNKNLTL